MTENHQDDQVPQAARAGATTAPRSADQPTERIATGPHGQDAVSPSAADRATQPLAAAPHAADAGGFRRPDHPTQAMPIGPGAHHDAAYARPAQPTQAVPVAPHTAGGAQFGGPAQQAPVAPHAAGGAQFAAPSQPTSGQPGTSTTMAAHAGGTPWAQRTFAAPNAGPQHSGAPQPTAPFAAPTPAWLGGPPQQPPTPPAGHPLAGWGQQPARVGTTTTTKSRKAWTPLVGTAAAAALLASFATAGLTGAFGADDSTSPTASSIATIGQSSTDTVPVAGSTTDNPDWEKVAASVAASVVAIQVTTATGGGEGSGVIIDDAGHILTNNHVVSGAENDTVQVTLNDGRLYKATVVGTDSSTDLAIVQIKDAPKDLSPAALGDSSKVVVGAPVMAVGNPLGLANTVTTGIVSAVDRPVSASSAEATSASDVVVTNAIQIDAAINPGNSGGPLFDAQGRVVGITSSIATLSSGGSQSGSIGLGFAIPINPAKTVAQQLIKDGVAEHAFLGVSLTDGTATADGVTRRGAVVQQVTAGSPAAAAELKAGDVIVAIDGEAVGGAESLTAYVRERTAGDTAKLTIVRDGASLDVTVTLATRETAVAASDQGSGSSQGDGSSDGGTEQGGIPGFPGSGVNPADPFGDQG